MGQSRSEDILENILGSKSRCDCFVKYIGVVTEVESTTVISNNLENLHDKFFSS